MKRLTVVYVSAATEIDEQLRQELEKHLRPLERQGLMEGWHAQQIPAGSVEAEGREAAFNKASLVLLLISADFHADVSCQEWMQRALERQRRGEVQVLPILLRPVDRHSTPFSHLQALPTSGEPITNWPNRDAAFAQVTEGIRCVLEGRPLLVIQNIEQEVSLDRRARKGNIMSSPPSSNRLAIVLWTLTLFAGLPSIVVLTLTQKMILNPFLSILLFIACEILAFFISILIKIWTRLEPSWIESICQHVDAYIRQIFSSDQKKYYKYLYYSNRDLDMKGHGRQNDYTLNIDEVFVDLSIIPMPSHRITANPIEFSKHLPKGKNSIWSYLSSADCHFAIIGPPGSGKTTLLKDIVLKLVSGKKFSNAVVPSQFSNKIPIFLYLRDHAHLLGEHPEVLLLDMLRDHLKKKKWEAEVPLEWIDQKLAKGRCIILLDGLDEVADSTLRHRIVDWVQNQMVTYGKNRFLITSRPFGYRDYPLNGATVLEVQPFSKEKIKEFVHSWYIANEMRSAQRGKDDPAVRLRAETGAEDLLQRMRSKPVLFDLAVNPLLLTMIATVHRDRNSLPGKRVDLYAEICEVFLGKRQEVRGLRLELTPAQTQKVLQPLAFDMMSKGKRDISLADAQKAIADSLSQVSPIIQPRYFLKLVENSSGLLLERERELYTFAHLTFQEYLASVHIKEEKFERLLVAQIDMSWWHETIRLYCAQADASAIMMACIESQYPSIPALMLALECPQEALMVQASVRHQLEIFINQSIENGDAKRRSLIAETFLTQRIYQMPSLEKETYIDRSLITCAEYQLFLDDKQKNGIYCAPDHWASNFFSENQGRMPVLGVRISDAKMFCQWLTQRSLGIWQYRLPTTDDLEEFPESGSINSNVGNKTIYWISNGEKFTGGEDFSSTLEVRQRYFAPESLRNILPLLKLVLALPRECSRTFSAEKASNFVATLKPVIKLALSIAHESGMPDWIISYYSSLSPEGLDLPPNPSRAFNELINFLEKVINPRPYLVSFLDAVDRYIQRNGLTLDSNLDRTLIDKSAPVFKIIQIAEGISNIATQNLDKIEDTLIGIGNYIRTSYYPKAENRDKKANDPVRNGKAVSPRQAWTARGVFIDIQKDFPTINFPMLETQIINLGSHLMANHDSPAFGLDSSLTEISNAISRFDLEALLNVDPIITISQALLDTLDLSRQRRFNSLYVPEGILPDGSLLVFLHLLLRILTIRLVEYLQELQKNIDILHESSILPYPGNGYHKVKKDLNAAINQCISIYVTSTLIGERYLSHLPAYEGILIVKEPKVEI